jgi:FtsZ-binding cell division protein ZapB
MYVLRNVNVQGTNMSGEVVVVEVNDYLENNVKNKVQNTIDLYQLNTRYYERSTHTLKQKPDDIRQQDMRLFNRTEAWKQAQRLLQDTDIQRACRQYSNDSSVLETALRFVSNMATQTGFWSVWMTVFWQEFKNPHLLHELFVQTIRRPEDIVSGYQALSPDTPLTSGHRPDRSTSNVTYLHFPGTAIERIFYRP